MPALSPAQLLLLVGGVLLATLILGALLAALMVWLTREVQAAYGQAPAAQAKAPAPAAEAAAAPSQRIGPWPFVISGLALLVVLAVIFYPMPQPQTAPPIASSEGHSAVPTPLATPAAVALQGNPEKGKELFAGTCASCHGPDAKGLPGLGKDLTTSVFVKQQTDAQLLEFIKKGRPATDPANTTGVDMPPKGGNPALTDQDLADIIAFIRTFNPHQP
ncbi:c-type cytochrome [Thermoflexus sp.]|uniref:c-type cytochrome n=1 Tax=Thermoflexus sp. TaxID=1969742 RepID=UPI0035E41E7A